MPHITRYTIDGKYLPSVNTITGGSLSKEGLIRNYYRKHGFEWCDKDSDAAKKRGSELAEAMEVFRKTEQLPRKKLFKACVLQWLYWYTRQPYSIDPQFVEPHLVNPGEGYHGSPDIVFRDGILGDDKLKKRFPDYGLLMNEHAYAMCTHVDIGNGKLEEVPWKVPIQYMWMWTYNPETGKLYPQHHQFKVEVWEDFLRCKAMYHVNKTAEKYFEQFATLLPQEQTFVETETIS